MTFPNGGERSESDPARKVDARSHQLRNIYDTAEEARNTAIGRLSPELRDRVGNRAGEHAANQVVYGEGPHQRGGVGRYMGSLGEGRSQRAFISPESTGGGASDSIEVAHAHTDWEKHLLGHPVAFLPHYPEFRIDKGVELHRLADYDPATRERMFGHLPGYSAFSTPEALERKKPEIG